jgi:hypothetical protein
MAKRDRFEFLPIRDPLWRERVAVQILLPGLAVLLATTVAWFISQI